MKDVLTVFPLKRGDINVGSKGKNLSKFGGIKLVRKFFRHLKVKEELEGAVPFERRNRKFTGG